MMGPRQVDQAALFYEFSLERHVPAAHLLRAIDWFVDLSDVRGLLLHFTAQLAGLRLIPNCSCGCCWLAIATALFRMAVVRGGAPEPCLPLVLSARPRWRGAGPLDLL